MARAFEIGDLVRFTGDTKARDQYGQVIRSGNFYIEAYSKGRVVAYNDKYTDSTNDDIVKIEIKSGDDTLNGKTVWVKSSDFEKVDKVY